MSVRVLVPEASRAGEQLVLPADEAAHVTRVLRLGTGATLRVFNGRGHEWTATIVRASKTTVAVSLDAPADAARETRVRYRVALAVLKGDGTDEAVRDAVMMGAAEIQPFVSARSETTVPAVRKAQRTERWTRVAVASAKQCGRAVVPEVAGPVSFADLIAAHHGGPRVLLVEPSLPGAVRPVADLPQPTAVTIAVGPEGGWTPAELALAAEAGWILVRLGGRTLRATSTPLAALAACQAVWRDE